MLKRTEPSWMDIESNVLHLILEQKTIWFRTKNYKLVLELILL